MNDKLFYWPHADETKEDYGFVSGTDELTASAVALANETAWKYALEDDLKGDEK